MKYQLLKDTHMQVKSSGNLGNVAEMKNIKCNSCKYETIFTLLGLSFIYFSTERDMQFFHPLAKR
jgi:hypothetical protein